MASCLPKICLCFLVLYSCQVSCVYAETGQEENSVLDLSLRQAIELAKENSPLIKIGELEVDSALQKSQELTGKIISPRFSATSYTGLVNEARGDATSSADTSEEYDDMGPFFKIDMNVVQPIYTFGKYSSATQAGKSYLQMHETNLLEQANSLSFQVIKAYLGVVSGREGIEVGNELMDKYRYLLKKVEDLLAAEDPMVDDSHLLETKAMLFEVERDASKAQTGLEEAELYLKGLINQGRGLEVVTQVPKVPDFFPESTNVEEIIEYAHESSKELKSLDLALRSLQEKAELETKMKLPDVFVAGTIGYGVAPNRDKQVNPFIDDEYNYQKIGAVVGMNWKFNYSTNTAKEKQAVIDYLKAAEKRKATVLRLDAEVQKYFQRSRRYWTMLGSVHYSLKAARTWTMLESDNFDLGIGEVKRFIDAYRKYFSLQAYEIDTRNNYLVSLAELAKSIGDTELLLQWETDGKVRLP